ncbi:MAG: transposase [Hyphomicrobiales bacterium]|nr:transposase [Hyphomicrobiales bacterium]
MPRKRHKAEEIVTKLRQVDVLTAQGRPVGEAIRSIGVTEVTYYRWRSEYGGLKGDQVKRLKELEAENTRLRRAVSDLTLVRADLGLVLSRLAAVGVALDAQAHDETYLRNDALRELMGQGGRHGKHMRHFCLPPSRTVPIVHDLTRRATLARA